jgi:outer membrane protein OmpA-like peptidoglycan-associated protein/N-acetylneuraminic acid mutarotase
VKSLLRLKSATVFFVIGFSAFLSAQEATSWIKKSNFPAGTMEKATAFSLGDKGYAGTGYALSSYKKDFWQYDPKKDKWLQIQDLPGEPRISAVSFTIGNKGYLGTGMTGFEGMRKGTNDFWEYDTLKKVWSQKANLPGEVRYGAVGFAIRDKGYIGLGANKAVCYSDLWEYDPGTNQWTQKTDFPGGGRGDAAVFVAGGEAYLLLGQKKEMLPSQKDCWKFEPKKNEWKQVADFPGQARVGALAFAYKNKGFIACGFNGALKRYEDFWEYDSYTDKWSQKPDVPFGTRSYIFVFVIGSNAYVGTGHSSQKNAPGFDVWKIDLSQDKKNKDRFALGGSFLLGENRFPLAAVGVKILNSKNEVVKTSNTGLFGSFLLTDLSTTEDYTLVLEVEDPHMRTQQIYLVDREKETVAVLNLDNRFTFHISASDKSKLKLLEIDNKDIRMDINGKLALSDASVPFANAAISLVNDQEETVQNTTTDKNGNFTFNYLMADTNLYLTIDEKAKTSLPKGTTILLMDDKANILNKSTAESGEFLLVNLPPENNKLAKIYVEDPWLQITFGSFSEGALVIENVYFDLAKWDLGSVAKAVLNKVVIVMKNNNKISLELTAHTDSRGDSKANMTLSDKRAQEAKKYIVSQGVDAKRIIAKGFGESRLLNDCKDNVPCSEEEHAKNRRMEFRINRGVK